VRFQTAFVTGNTAFLGIPSLTIGHEIDAAAVDMILLIGPDRTVPAAGDALLTEVRMDTATGFMDSHTIEMVMEDVGAGSEASSWTFRQLVAGSLTNAVFDTTDGNWTNAIAGGEIHIRAVGGDVIQIIPAAQTNNPVAVTIPDAGASTAEFVLTAGDSTISGDKTFTGDLNGTNSDRFAVELSAALSLGGDGDIGIDTSDSQFQWRANGATFALMPFRTESYTIQDPANNTSETMFRLQDVGAEILQVCTVIQGSSTPSVAWNMHRSTTRPSGDNVFTSDRSSTSLNGECFTTDFDDPTAVAESWVWVNIGGSGISGTVDEIIFWILYAYDLT